MNYDFKKFFYHCFLTVLLGLTISVCSRIDESDTAIASSSAVVDGSAEGYIRIGNMQELWGTANVTNGATWTYADNGTTVNYTGATITFPKAFLSDPVVTATCEDNRAYITNVKTYTTKSSVALMGCNAGYRVNWKATGVWQ